MTFVAQKSIVSHSTELMHIARLHLLCKFTAPGITGSDHAKLMSQALILSVRLSSHHSYKDKAAAEGRGKIDNDLFFTYTYCANIAIIV